MCGGTTNGKQLFGHRFSAVVDHRIRGRGPAQTSNDICAVRYLFTLISSNKYLLNFQQEHINSTRRLKERGICMWSCSGQRACDGDPGGGVTWKACSVRLKIRAFHIGFSSWAWPVHVPGKAHRHRLSSFIEGDRVQEEGDNVHRPVPGVVVKISPVFRLSLSPPPRQVGMSAFARRGDQDRRRAVDGAFVFADTAPDAQRFHHIGLPHQD